VSLTWKLVLGFLFAAALQVVQLLISSHFTRQLLTASVQVSEAVRANGAARAGIEVVHELQARLTAEPASGASLRVHADAAAAHARELGRGLADDDLMAAVTTALGRVEAHVRLLEAAGGTAAAARDAPVLLGGASRDLEQALRRALQRTRTLAAEGAERVRAVQDLPEQVGLALMVGGILAMAAFVVWYSRQLVLPIERARGALECRVAERTAELMAAHDRLVGLNRELTAARDVAETANRTKTMFLANVSHELRTPMTAILGYAEVLQDDLGCRAASAVETEALATIRRNAQHMVGIVSDLLDMAKLEAGKLAVEIQPCSPLQVASDVLVLLRPKAQQRGLELALRLATPVPATIASDALRLRQILLNLVDNAIKFTADGSVCVELALAAASPQLHFAVRDTGIGMGADLLARLFRPFEQADVSTTRRFGGTGLGLAISRQLAQLLGGDIVAASEPGRGSVFTLSVETGALDGVERVHAPPQAASGAPPLPLASAIAGTRVLLVEDGPDNQRLLSYVLRRNGCEVTVAANGQDGLDRVAAAAGAFDLVLMDIQMPVLDGISATRRLREQGFRAPIVALTANAMPAHEAECRAAGCDAFLTKPIDRQRLLATIERLRPARA
jgi:signal transduction histidine kinase/ActR/RegA family two-component response regulator